MNSAADRDILERQTVAGFNCDFFAAGYLLAGFHALSSQNIVVFAVRLFDTGNPGAAVGIILNMLNNGFGSIRQAEVDQAIEFLGAAALVAGSYAALVIAAVAAALSHQQRAQWFL